MEAAGAPNPPPVDLEPESAPAIAPASTAGGEGAGLPDPEGAETATWPDAAAEATFLAEARERGEVPVAATAREEIAEETDGRALPALDTLVQRIPPEVREALDDLFRARFVRVTRLPRKALKP
jgi:hypothetical protein